MADGVRYLLNVARVVFTWFPDQVLALLERAARTPALLTVGLGGDGGGGDGGDGGGDPPADGDGQDDGGDPPADGDGQDDDGEESVPLSKHKEAIRESRKRKAKIRELEAELAAAKSGATPTERESQLQAERDALALQLAGAETRTALSRLVDGADGRPAPVDALVLDQMVTAAQREKIDAEDMADFVTEFVSDHRGLFRTGTPDVPADPAAIAAATHGVTRAGNTPAMDSVQDIQTWRTMTPEQRNAYEERNPGTKKRMHRLTTTAITSSLRRDGVRVDGSE